MKIVLRNVLQQKIEYNKHEYSEFMAVTNYLIIYK